MMQLRISCPNPICPQPQDVQKVSILVLQGSGQVTLADSSRSSSVTGQTGLSKLLAAPPEPKPPRDDGSISYALLYLLPVGFLVAAFSFILFITAEAIVIVDGRGQGVPIDELLQILLITFGTMVFFGLFSYVALIRPLRRYRRRHTTWVKAKVIWDELYYCHHCDTVFNPADPLWAAVPASQMKELLG